MSPKQFIPVFLMVVVVLFCSSTVFAQEQRAMTVLQPILIERAVVLDAGQVAIDAGLALESDREYRGLEYDNVRLAPLGARFGLSSDIELGANLAFSSNDANQPGAPNKSGLEGVTLFGKLKLSQNSTLRVGLVMAGEDDIYPYPNDGVDFFANLALQKPVEMGLVYGEFGYKAQGGDLDYNSYFNYGVGYSVPVARTVGLNLELIGEQAQEVGIANTLDLLLGVNLLIGDMMRLAPYATFGLNDASPDVAAGALFELRI